MSTADEKTTDWERVGRRALDSEYSRFFDEEVAEAFDDYSAALRDRDGDEREAFVQFATRASSLLNLILTDLLDRDEDPGRVGGAPIAAAQLAEVAERISAGPSEEDARLDEGDRAEVLAAAEQLTNPEGPLLADGGRADRAEVAELVEKMREAVDGELPTTP